MKCVLLETATGRIVREQDFEELPPALAEAKGLQWYVLIDNVPDYNPSTHTRKPDGQTADDQARTLTKHYRVDPLPAEAVQAKLQKDIVAQTQQRLDTFARTRNYDNILSACTYATSAAPQFATEGQYCVSARDATWTVLYQIMDEVNAGSRPAPTGYADIEPDLPTLAWP